MSDAIAAVSQIVSPAVQQEAASAPGELGKEDFLKLLVAQMQQQDPLNPEDPTEFTAQLTQFSQLEQSITMNQQLENLLAQQAMATTLGATNYIGRAAEFEGELLQVDDGQPAQVKFELLTAAQDITVNIRDESGQLVDVVELDGQPAGVHAFQWDGKLNNGEQAEDGDYFFEVTGHFDGKASPAYTRFSEKITGVRFEQGGTILELSGGREVSLNSIIAISEYKE